MISIEKLIIWTCWVAMTNRTGWMKQWIKINNHNCSFTHSLNVAPPSTSTQMTKEKSTISNSESTALKAKTITWSCLQLKTIWRYSPTVIKLMSTRNPKAEKDTTAPHKNEMAKALPAEERIHYKYNKCDHKLLILSWKDQLWIQLKEKIILTSNMCKVWPITIREARVCKSWIPLPLKGNQRVAPNKQIWDQVLWFHQFLVEMHILILIFTHKRWAI